MPDQMFSIHKMEFNQFAALICTIVFPLIVSLPMSYYGLTKSPFSPETLVLQLMATTPLAMYRWITNSNFNIKSFLDCFLYFEILINLSMLYVHAIYFVRCDIDNKNTKSRYDILMKCGGHWLVSY